MESNVNRKNSWQIQDAMFPADADILPPSEASVL